MYFVISKVNKVNNNNQKDLQKQIQDLQQKIEILENQEQVKIDDSDFDDVDVDEIVDEKVDEFTDWQTYTNSEYWYKINYPENWYQVSDSSVIPGVTAEFFGNMKPPYENSYFGMMSYDTGMLINVTASDKKEEYLKGDTFLSENQISFNNIQATKKISQTIYPHMIQRGNKYIGIYFTRNNKNYSIEGEMWLADFEKYEAIFNQILSSFKFLN